MKKILCLLAVSSLYLSASGCLANTAPCDDKSIDEYANTAGDIYRTIRDRTEALQNWEYCKNTNIDIKKIAAIDKGTLDKQLKSQAKFMDNDFGLGFAVSFPDDDIVVDAEVVNGIVVVKEKRESEARVLLEFHSYIDKWSTTELATGPFAALATTESDLLGGVGIGWLWSTKSSIINQDNPSSFSFGFGYILDNKVKTLANGFKEGEALPDGESSVRFIEKSRGSWMIFVSNNF